MRKLYILTLLFLTICACNRAKKEYTIEVSNSKRDLPSNELKIEHQNEIIKAVSDSEAYANGFTNFCIHAKVYRQFNTTSLPEPIAFRVLDKNKLDISYDLSDTLKRQIETSVLKSFQTDSNKDSIRSIINAKDRILYIQDILDNKVTFNK